MSGYAKNKVVDESSAVNQPKQNVITGNIIIYILVGLCILLIIFISIGVFFIAKPLQASLTSVAMRNLEYNGISSSSSSPYFNATLAMVIRIENPNRGFFEFHTSKGDVLYNGRRVGEMKIDGQRVASHTAIRTAVTAEVSCGETRRSSDWFKNDLKRGLIILKIGAKLRGEVHLKALNKRTVNLKCLMHLNLVDEVIQRLWCK